MDERHECSNLQAHTELSPLCSDCQAFLSGAKEHEDFTQPYSRSTSVKNVLSNAAAGCTLCAWLERKCQNESVDVEARMSLWFFDEIGFRTLYGELDGRVRIQFSFAVVPYDDSVRSCLQLPFEDKIRTPAHDTNDSASSKALAAFWLRTCHRLHEFCTAGRPATHWLPRRLVSFGLSEREDAEVQILSRDQVGSNRSYVALSYCWGSSPPLTLNSQTYGQFERGVPVATLPKTFHDAVKVCRWLGYSLLWIDSLCIKQDCPEDWSTESHAMKSVYGYAALTIAAADSKDSNGGLFAERRPESITPPIVQIPLTTLSDTRHCLVDERLWESELDHSTLSRRGWAVQERFLSPRTLYFAKSQMFYQCCQLSVCESFPAGHLQAQVVSFKNLGHAAASPADIWDSAAKAYTGALLTRETDKVIAIAGVAEQIQELVKEEYVVGLWKHNIELELVWSILEPDATTRASPQLAPTWSWLSLTGCYLHRPNASNLTCDPLVTVLDVHVDLVDSTHPTGNIRSASLRLRGVLKPASWIDTATGNDIRSSRPSSYGLSVDLNGASESVSFRFDISPDTVSWTPESFLLPVCVTAKRESGLNKAVKGLILVLKNRHKSIYERIGAFELNTNWSTYLFLRKVPRPTGEVEQNLSDHSSRLPDPAEDAIDANWEQIPTEEITIV